MSINKKDNKFISLVIVLISLFILVIFTKNMYYTMQENLDIKNNLETDLQEKNSDLRELETLEKELKSWDKKEEISQFLKTFSEDEILVYLNEYVQELNSSSGAMIINGLTFKDEIQSELWFKEVWLTISAKVSDKQTLKTFLEFLTNKNSKYSFFLTDFSFPNNDKPWIFSVSIPLKLFYK